MCGRFLLNSPIGDIIKKYSIFYREDGEYSSGDVYPTQNALIVLEGQKRIMTQGKWGFANYKTKRAIINARAETAIVKPMFKKSVYGARCIIPSNGFYEWKDEGKGKKVKYKIGLKDGGLISLGGIYKISLDEDFRERLSFVIITTEAQGNMKAIHHRMPLIINDDVLDAWLNKNTSMELVEKVIKSKIYTELVIDKCG
ncbi:MAG TPA: SOS response-associated peptidase [Clostridiales bacterium]|nr:SOS response-associated peptidase [Clostridiales bacterium]